MPDRLASSLGRIFLSSSISIKRATTASFTVISIIAYIGDGYVEVQIMEAYYIDMEYMGNKQEDFERYGVAISYSYIDESVVEEILAAAEQAENDLYFDL